MPQVKSQNPKSLKKLCAEFVASNLDHWCNQEAALSQFDKLPSVLLEEILKFVSRLLNGSVESPISYPPSWSRYKMKLKTQLFELLITPYSISLDLSMGELDDVPYILNLASLRCPDLQAVRIVSPHSIDMCVHLCAMKFESLQVLTLAETDAGDYCLQILGMYCKDLRELYLRDCKKITDAGIQGLCVSVHHLGKSFFFEDQRLGQCKSIEILEITGTKITKKGIQTALINLPFLKKFQLPRRYTSACTEASIDAVPVQLLAEIHQSDWNDIKRLKDIRKYSLEGLFLDHEEGETFNITPYASGNLGLVASLCPLVTSVRVELITGLTDSEMLGLLSLKNVNELEIDGIAELKKYAVNTSVTFEGGVVPLLKGFGNSLKELTLFCLKNVNIRAIIDFCPKLQSLTLENNIYTTGSAKGDAKPCRMRNLKHLRVVYERFDYRYRTIEDISSEDLLSLLSFPSLIKIDIWCCPNLTDNIFERASEIHQFLSLEELLLQFCPSVTRRGIDVVMNNKTPLDSIEIYCCDNITADDRDLLISKARSEKWQLCVEYNDTD